MRIFGYRNDLNFIYRRFNINYQLKHLGSNNLYGVHEEYVMSKIIH